MTAVFSLVLLLGVFGGCAWYARRSSIRLDGRCWDQLVAAYEPVNLQGMQSIARDCMEPRRGGARMQPTAMWAVVGGEAGLRVMERNATLLLSIAAQVAESAEDLAAVSEQMRRDALQLRSAVRSIRFGLYSQMLTGRHWVSVPFQLQQAASAYFLMRQRLMAMIEVGNMGMMAQVSQAI